jgi:hypothetical protein
MAKISSGAATVEPSDMTELLYSIIVMYSYRLCNANMM